MQMADHAKIQLMNFSRIRAATVLIKGRSLGVRSHDHFPADFNFSSTSLPTIFSSMAPPLELSPSK